MESLADRKQRTLELVERQHRVAEAVFVGAIARRLSLYGYGLDDADLHAVMRDAVEAARQWVTFLSPMLPENNGENTE